MATLLRAPLRLYRYAVLESVQIVRRHGARELLRQRGWRFAGALLAYYLIRDTVLYLVVPLWIAHAIR